MEGQKTENVQNFILVLRALKRLLTANDDHERPEVVASPFARYIVIPFSNLGNIFF